MLKNEIETISNTDLTDEEISKFKIKPFQHQVEAVNFGLKHKGWLLLDSMGVGKTAEVIYYAEALKRRGLIDHALIICGVDSLRQNWKNEIKTFSNFPVRVLGEKLTKTGRITYTSISERVDELKQPINEFFVVMNIATLRDDRIVDVLRNKKNPNKFGLIAVDEVHRCLTADTKIKTENGEYSIKDFIDLKDRPKVLSHNIKTNIDEYKCVEDIYISKPQEPLIELSIMESGKIYILKCTESHKIFTKNRGWVKAKNLTDQDDIQILS